ncbi:MAG: carboxypeptidase regulatory-like domain-containing protein [Pyrinomonadaceae bacterium]|nr:carboxypeptidase regulatory-like domain-containing protein [Pyrinomonadaceae bacterium]
MKVAALLLLITLVLPATAAMRWGAPTSRAPESNAANAASRGASRAVAEDDFDLSDFGAVGDGVADDGPALQSALDAIANAGGGTLFVPAGRYAINTPVQKDFTGLATSVTIQGVESSTPVPPPTAAGNDLTHGLDLVSEFAPRTGELQNALSISGLETFLMKDVVFIGTPGVNNDALVTLALTDISKATIRHCEFYGLSSLEEGGAIVQAVRSDLTFEQSVVLGSTCSSGVYSSIIQNLYWKGITIQESVFADYGQRAELYGKMHTAPLSWVNLGNAAPPDNDSPRREAVVRSVFFDEGGYVGISNRPDHSSPIFPIDLLYITAIFINVSNFGTTGNYLDGIENVLIEKSHYGWSHNTGSAINLLNVGNAIIDETECVDAADRIAADSATGKLTVINSTYTHLDSQAQITNVITTATPDEDPVQHVRQQFMAILAREPDPAAHFYWSDRILECGADAECVDGARAALAAYLDGAPAPKFAITGRITGESGENLPGVSVTLSGGQSVTTTTDSAGQYHFSNLPTSGVYTVTPTLTHHTLNPSSRTIVTPTGDQVFDSAATFNHHAISGRVTNPAGAGLADVTVTLSGAQSATMNTGADGNYSFANLDAGGNYTVSPQKTSYTFSPASQTFPDLGGDQSTNFTGTFVTYTINGILVDGNNNPMPGVTITLSGSQTGTTTTDNTGTFSFTGLASEGNYTVTPTLISYTFSPSSRIFNNLAADHYHNYLATYTTHSVSGRVTDAVTGAALSGAVVTFSGSTNGTTVTNANGDYSYQLPHGGSYPMTVAKAHYTFAQPSQTFNNLSSAKTANLTATLNRHSISGRATGSDGSGLPGIAVNLSGTETSTVTTDSTGAYAFANLPGGGDYTVTPTLVGYTFSPSFSTFNNLAANQNQNYQAVFTTHTVSGRVTDASSGAALSGAVVTFSGFSSGTTVTNANGDYSYQLAHGGSYTMTVAKAHYTFAQPSQTFDNFTAAQTASFTATLNRYSISGRATGSNGSGLSGVTVNLSGSQTSSVTTDSTGAYAFANLPGSGNYTVVSSKTGYSWIPQSLVFNDLGSNQTGNFTGTFVAHNVSGRVTENGAGFSGVSLVLSGSQTSTTTTDAGGNYSFTLSSEGNFTVTPSKEHYTFTPASLTLNNLAASHTANFAATRNRHLISGRVANVNNTGVAGITVALSGSQTATATTDSAGQYSFANLPAGGDYSVAPSLPYHSFAPASQTFTNLAASQQVAFIVTLNTHTISGNVTNAIGSPVAGVFVALSGSLGPISTFTTGADGHYSFGSLPAGAPYIVTASKPDHIFNPSSRSFGALGFNETASFTTAPRIIEFSAANYSVAEGTATITITVSRTGDTSAEAEVTYSASNGTGIQGQDTGAVIGQLLFAPGETTRTFTIFITDDAFVESAEQLTVTLSLPQGAVLGSLASATLTISDNDSAPADPNPVDEAQFFVRQHYRDFLNREPDAAGLAFWSNQILACGTNAACVEDRRINVSAAFFLSIEFQETGFLVHRVYKAAFAQSPKYLNEFLLDARTIAQGVVVDVPGWQQLLEANKTAYLNDFVERSNFRTQYPLSLSPAEFVNSLNAKAGSPLTANGVAAAVAEFNGSTTSSETSARARVLRRIAESETLSQRELSPAFVLMQYFGYLQRNPPDPPDNSLEGYNFWLGKLNEFGGDFRNAQMVKSFLVSGEYRSRFGL